MTRPMRRSPRPAIPSAVLASANRLIGDATEERLAAALSGALSEAEAALADLNAADLDAAVRIIAGSARSMGLETEGVE